MRHFDTPSYNLSIKKYNLNVIFYLKNNSYLNIFAL